MTSLHFASTFFFIIVTTFSRCNFISTSSCWGSLAKSERIWVDFPRQWAGAANSIHKQLLMVRLPSTSVWMCYTTTRVSADNRTMYLGGPWQNTIETIGDNDWLPQSVPSNWGWYAMEQWSLVLCNLNNVVQNELMNKGSWSENYNGWEPMRWTTISEKSLGD